MQGKNPISDVKLLDCMEGCKKHHWLGKKHKPETIQKMREARLKNNPMKKKEVVEKRSKTLKENGVFSGDKNPKWKGGCRKYRGVRWSEARDKRRNIDKYSCQSCGITEVEYKRQLDVHHIIDYKDGGTNDLSNLVTLCRSCHNSKRKHDATITR